MDVNFLCGIMSHAGILSLYSLLTKCLWAIFYTPGAPSVPIWYMVCPSYSFSFQAKTFILMLVNLLKIQSNDFMGLIPVKTQLCVGVIYYLNITILGLIHFSSIRSLINVGTSDQDNN